MLLMWGPELAMVYNDGYAPMLGPRHRGPRAPAPEVWDDVWTDIGPMIDRCWPAGPPATRTYRW